MRLMRTPSIVRRASGQGPRGGRGSAGGAVRFGGGRPEEGRVKLPTNDTPGRNPDAAITINLAGLEASIQQDRAPSRERDPRIHSLGRCCRSRSHPGRTPKGWPTTSSPSGSSWRTSAPSSGLRRVPWGSAWLTGRAWRPPRRQWRPFDRPEARGALRPRHDRPLRPARREGGRPQATCTSPTSAISTHYKGALRRRSRRGAQEPTSREWNCIICLITLSGKT